MTEPLVVAAAGKDRDQSRRNNMLELFLERWGSKIRFTEEVVKEAVKTGADRLRFLFDKRDDQVNITEDILMTAVEQYYARDLLSTILTRRRSRISISERIAKAVSGPSQRHTIDFGTHASSSRGILGDRRGH